MNCRIVVMLVQDYLTGKSTLDDLYGLLLGLLYGGEAHPEETIAMAQLAAMFVDEYSSGGLTLEELHTNFRDGLGINASEIHALVDAQTRVELRSSAVARSYSAVLA